MLCVLLSSILVALIVFISYFFSLINFRWFRLAYSVFFLMFLKQVNYRKKQKHKIECFIICIRNGYDMLWRNTIYIYIRFVCGELLTFTFKKTHLAHYVCTVHVFCTAVCILIHILYACHSSSNCSLRIHILLRSFLASFWIGIDGLSSSSSSSLSFSSHTFFQLEMLKFQIKKNKEK